MFPNSRVVNEDLGCYLRNFAAFNEIYLSPHVEIPANPPQLLSVSMKNVYLVNNYHDIIRLTEKIKEKYNIKMIVNRENKSHVRDINKYFFLSARINNFDIYLVSSKFIDDIENNNFLLRQKICY